MKLLYDKSVYVFSIMVDLIVFLSNGIFLQLSCHSLILISVSTLLTFCSFLKLEPFLFSFDDVIEKCSTLTSSERKSGNSDGCGLGLT